MKDENLTITACALDGVSDTVLCKFVTGHLPADVQAEIAVHLDVCDSCNARAKALRAEFEMFLPAVSGVRTPVRHKAPKIRVAPRFNRKSLSTRRKLVPS